jgi:hypothetical protein
MSAWANLLIHIPNILRLDIVMFDHLSEESEVVMDDRSGRGLSTASFQRRRPFDLEIRVALLEADWPSDTQGQSENLGHIVTNHGQAQQQAAFGKALVGVR